MSLDLTSAWPTGTLDEAKGRVLGDVVEDNSFFFGLTAPDVAATRAAGYKPAEALKKCPELQEVLLAMRDGLFSPDEPQRYQSIYDALVNWGDHYLLLADYPGYAAAQNAADAAYRHPDAWPPKAPQKHAGMGPFSCLSYKINPSAQKNEV